MEKKTSITIEVNVAKNSDNYAHFDHLVRCQQDPLASVPNWVNTVNKSLEYCREDGEDTAAVLGKFKSVEDAKNLVGVLLGYGFTDVRIVERNVWTVPTPPM